MTQLVVYPKHICVSDRIVADPRKAITPQVTKTQSGEYVLDYGFGGVYVVDITDGSRQLKFWYRGDRHVILDATGSLCVDIQRVLKIDEWHSFDAALIPLCVGG